MSKNSIAYDKAYQFAIRVVNAYKHLIVFIKMLKKSLKFFTQFSNPPTEQQSKLVTGDW
jgi:hypothetical protein